MNVDESVVALFDLSSWDMANKRYIQLSFMLL